MSTPPVPDVLSHVDAVKAALTAAGLSVFVGGTPAGAWTPPDKFAVLHPDAGTAVRESLADERTTLDCLMQITCVGGDVERALWVAGRVRRALAKPLAVDGRVCWRPEDLGGPPVQRDDDITPPLYFVPVQYRICSAPA
ncbi:hypothetical protein ACFQ9J_28385 [Streptomyces sp. NPDC056529]|uniref:hypothetical protein n=1 Tax=Streptomyces sp. NPDC056529 TaxID=3345855 RepID=UPI0036900DA1